MAFAAHFGGVASVADASTTLTAEDMPIGTPAANRLVVALFSILAPGVTTVSATIGGVAATVHFETGSLTLGVATAIVSSGTTADVVVTLDADGYAFDIATWALTGQVSLLSWDADENGSSSGSVTLNELAGGATLALALSNDDNPGTWTYPTEDGHVDNAIGARVSAASRADTSEGSRSIGITGSTDLADVIAAHFVGPALASADFTLDDLISEATNAPQKASADFTLDDLTSEGYGASDPPPDYFSRVLVERNGVEPIIILATITHQSLATPIRLALNTPGHDILSNGDTYTATYFDVALVSDNEGPPVAKLRVPNVNRQVGALLDGITDAPMIRFDVILASNPNQVERSFRQMKLKQASWDASMVEADLGQTDFADVPYPALAAIPALFPALFKK